MTRYGFSILLALAIVLSLAIANIRVRSGLDPSLYAAVAVLLIVIWVYAVSVRVH